MARLFRLEILTPSRSVFSGDVESVILPAVGGMVGILAGHAPLLAALARGDVTARTGAAGECFKIDGGYARVQDGRVLVLTDEAIAAG